MNKKTPNKHNFTPREAPKLPENENFVSHSDMPWPLMSECLERDRQIQIMNDKTPNKCMYIVENKDITWEYDEDSLRVKILEILDKLRKDRSQINFDSESARQSIASVIVDEL